MHMHSPTCLQGPRSGSREWWRAVEGSEPHLAAELAGPEPGFRADLVERVRREIAAGTYETPEKWEAALDRLAARLEARDA